MQLVLISGLSGSGKSVVLNVLEDAGYYCIDNLPANLLSQTMIFLEASGYDKVGITVDARSGDSFLKLPELVEQLRLHVDLRLIFLESKTETLVRRFSETRRRHPLSSDERSLREAIVLERELLSEIAQIGHHIDTSDLSANALRGWVKDLISLQSSRLTLLITSFGFKHGIPLDADLVFDVRCLPNPHYDPVLRPQTGRDADVIAFLEGVPEVAEMLADIQAYVTKWLPCYIGDNRAYLTVAIGCTGGQHRSVYFAEHLAAHFATLEQTLVRHRELR
ncbi:RNase adapter RapZ [Sulfuriferula sp.]|uniref:RNase adapter RapZ n=1 Tax=Sulfuriferula sp. TaxID=2025307 RepID=UPI0027318AD0|nr:RNase adapter RapZ [Sulfuriferula sp.]MDP2027613.1 RNase adapter RapZ [Sulfuriferula sp.]